MGVEIDLTISNVNNTDYSTILFRKFFNMVFVEPKGKKLQIYTATIFTAAEPNNSITECPIPKESSENCGLRFTYNILDAEKIEFVDITESLINQHERLNQVWHHCENLTNQTDISDRLKALYTKSHETPAMDQEKHFLYIHGPEANDKSCCCIASEGNFQDHTGENGHSYSLYCCNYSRIEAINWVKTTIVMPESILNKNVCFKISFEGVEKIYTPDFTWYFAPPINYIVDGNCTEVKVGNISEQNGIASVAERTTVDFKEWVDEEKISERNKSRVICLKEQIKSDLTCLTNTSIQVDLTFINPLKHANRQFFMGLIVAFALSYCSDKTRLNDYFSCIKGYCTCADTKCNCMALVNIQSVVFPVLILLSFIASIFRGKTCLPVKNWKRRVLYICKWGGIAATILLVVYVFILWLIIPDLVHYVVSVCAINKEITISLMTVGFIGNVAYISYCVFGRKRNVMDFF